MPGPCWLCASKQEQDTKDYSSENDYCLLSKRSLVNAFMFFTRVLRTYNLDQRVVHSTYKAELEAVVAFEKIQGRMFG